LLLDTWQTQAGDAAPGKSGFRTVIWSDASSSFAAAQQELGPQTYNIYGRMIGASANDGTFAAGITFALQV
jgi:hypothetical protein